MNERLRITFTVNGKSEFQEDNFSLKLGNELMTTVKLLIFVYIYWIIQGKWKENLLVTFYKVTFAVCRKCDESRLRANVRFNFNFNFIY